MNVGRDWEHPALTAALKAFALPRRAPTEADRPPVSVFPLTAAARAARRYDKVRAREQKREGRIEP